MGFRLTQDPNNASVIYASGAQTASSGYDFYIAKSSDWGATWPSRATFKRAYYPYDCLIKVAPWNTSQIFAAITYEDQNYKRSFEVHYAASNLAYWNNITGNLASLIGDQYAALYALYLGQDQTVYLATSSGLMMKQPGTTTWAKTDISGGVTDIAYEPVMHTLYASTYDGVQYSTDSGAHWQMLGNSGVRCTSLSVDVSNGILYTGTTGQSIYETRIGLLYSGASLDWTQY